MVGSPSKPKWVLGTTRSRAELHMVIHLHPKGPQNEHESRECDRMWARRSATYMDWAAPILTLTLPPSPLSPDCVCMHLPARPTALLNALSRASTLKVAALYSSCAPLPQEGTPHLRACERTPPHLRACERTPPLRLQRCWLSCMLPHLRSQRLRHHSSWCLACTTRARRSCPT